ncbi:hypothetical protein CDIK_3390 [Cucumispora dikerogammari]|nr:hypothetical protein CDIK_3390 [Cucumispora dikerogammari]
MFYRFEFVSHLMQNFSKDLKPEQELQKFFRVICRFSPLISATNGRRVPYSAVVEDGARAIDFKLFVSEILSILSRQGFTVKYILFYDIATFNYVAKNNFVEKNNLRKWNMSSYTHMSETIEFCFRK